MKQISEHSAGGVVFRQKEEGKGKREKGIQIEWLICKHSGYHKWVLPKGIIEAGEKPEEAAIREVREEAGVEAKIIKKITPEVRYKYIKNETLVDKTVDFFLMEYQAGDIKNHNWEMEDVRWVSVDEALKLMAFAEEKIILQAAAAMI